MFKMKIFTSLLVFSSLLFGTSVIKNETREIEKNIYQLNKKINYQEKDLNESQLDFFYLTSPSMIEKRIENLDIKQYLPMEYSKIFLSISNFKNLQNKYASQDWNWEKIKKIEDKFYHEKNFYFGSIYFFY